MQERTEMPGKSGFLAGVAYRNRTDDLRITRRIGVVRRCPLGRCTSACRVPRSAQVQGHPGWLLADPLARSTDSSPVVDELQSLVMRSCRFAPKPTMNCDFASQQFSPLHVVSDAHVPRMCPVSIAQSAWLRLDNLDANYRLGLSAASTGRNMSTATDIMLRLRARPVRFAAMHQGSVARPC